ncbi:cell division control protein 14, SIN component-domain-containing protein [Phlebopus sp. FC_14]|nr:cell division control protein 14, SIN component-domain-containing protein [Phlebopus sp. FC_14]
MATTTTSMKATIQDALDDISSVSSSSGCRNRALAILEQQLALACAQDVEDDTMGIFLDLQDTFECNVPSRTLAWIQIATSQIESTAGKSFERRENELNTLCSQLYQLLSITQGIVLHHTSSKAFLGRKYSLEVLIALLTTSRHTPMITHELGTGGSVLSPSSNKSSSVAHLSSAVLDTLLCVLVDSSPALRAFEEVNGVHAVVKILKRAGTPREVRMKCLEFLYFYLMDETGTHDTSSSPLVSHSTPTSPVTTQPNTPMCSPGPKIFPRPASGVSNLSFISGSSSSSSASASTSSSSLSSASSFTTTTSHTSVHSIRAPSPVKKSYSASVLPPDPHTPPNSPPPVPDPKRKPLSLQSRSMLMLRRDVDYEPLSPKKALVSRLGVGDGLSTPRTRRQATSSKSDSCSRSSPSLRQTDTTDLQEKPSRHERVRTTDEKKEILGTMLGNVDALVEGVRKAGIWGLS